MEMEEVLEARVAWTGVTWRAREQVVDQRGFDMLCWRQCDEAISNTTNGGTQEGTFRHTNHKAAQRA
jgi:hypothetical protein